ncbi:MAG: hypothetical protein IH965_11305, partial [Gemmatimonadetes bacterium]|nr:hypothetical protein [Gemmatimonadota bacterium]
MLIGMFIQSVRRLTLKPLVFLAVLSTAVILACKDDPLSPDGTGRLTITVVPYEGAQAEASAASDAESSAEARRSTTTSRGTTRPSEQTSDKARDLNIGPEKKEAKTTRQTAAAPPRRDLLRVTVSGPETRTLDFIPNADGSVDVTIESLPEGLYSVELLGIDIDLGVELVSEYGINNSVTVVEDQTRTAVISFGSFLPVIDPTLPAQTSEFSFVVGWAAIPSATGYLFELADPTFSTPITFSTTLTSVIITVDSLEPVSMRVRAENNNVPAAQAKPSDPVLVDVVADINPTGDDNTTAPSLGVGRGANGQYANFNIFPATDEDWFAIDLTTDATLTVDVLTESLPSPPPGGAGAGAGPALEVISAASASGASASPLDPVVEIFDPGLTVIATNDDRDATTV